MDASAYSLISIGCGNSNGNGSGSGNGSISGDSGYLNHHTQLDNHLHHPLHHHHHHHHNHNHNHHHHSLSNLINEDWDLEHDYHLNSHNNNNNNHHHHHMSSHNHNHGHQLRHSSSPYGLDLLTGSDQSLMAVDSCELIGLGTSGGGGGGGGDDDDDDLQGTLTSFVCTDLGTESDTGYTSGVDGYFNHSSTSLIDHCGSSDSQDAYCFRQFSPDSSLVSGCGTDTGGVNDGTSPLLMCHQASNNNLNNLGDFNQSDNQSAITSFSGCSYVGGGGGSSTSSSICSASNYSDIIINNSNDYYTNSSASTSVGTSNYYNDCTQATSDMTCQQQQLLSHNSQQHNDHSMRLMPQHHGQSSSSPSSSSSSSSSSLSATTAGLTKRSVLMNLLIDGSDIGAGYTTMNSRALQSIN